ncbi:MAG: ATP-dependent helicase [[Clostridium] leptum]
MSTMQEKLKKMNPRQLEAVLHTEGPLLILAGAGSGKTTVLINRIAYIIDQSLAKPWQILAITFTNKAAGELKERLTAMLGDTGGDVWAATFHSTCARILRRDGDRIGYSSHFTVYDTDDSKRLVKDCQKALNIDDKMISHKSILSEISHAKDSMLSPADYQAAAGSDFRLAKIGAVYELYQKRLREADAMDFDDLLGNTVELFRQCPDVLEYYQNRFRYILVDEYQDTNQVQYEFVRLLAEKSKNLCVVGDDDQSIYKFRGATIENIMSFEKSYPNAKVIRLEQNYRSTKNILNAANAVISNNEERKGKTLWTENPEGDKIQIHTSSNEQDEAGFVATTILEQVAKGRKYSDFAVLYRMNSQSNILEKVFVKSGIPYRIIGGHRFYERREIRDMIAYLSVINNPSDEIRLRRIVNQPKRSIGDKTIATASEIAGALGESLLEVLGRADEFDSLRRASVKLKAFYDMMQELIDANDDESVSLHELYELILEKTGYIEALRGEKEEAETRIENINELASNLLKFQEENGEEATLSAFLEEVSLMTDIDNYDETADTVVMMTMHSAKGLEFPVVFLPGFEEGIFPGLQAIYDPNEIQEERRLCYVAITRAKESLYLLNADSRMLFGSTSRNRPSRFSLEIPLDLINKTREQDWRKPDLGTKMPVAETELRRKSATAAMHFGQVTPPARSGNVFKTGDMVQHKTFGKGLVISATPMGNDVLLEIAFEQGTKKLMANFARLAKVE